MDCDADDGATQVEGHRYELEPAISTCAVCAMAADAFEVRAEELGCCEPFPLDACPLETSGRYEGCLRWQADQWATTIGEAWSCRNLVERTRDPRNWAGFECGGRFCFVPPLLWHDSIAEARAYCGGF